MPEKGPFRNTYIAARMAIYCKMVAGWYSWEFMLDRLWEDGIN